MLGTRRKFTLRHKIYLFFFVAGVIYMMIPHIVHADTFGYSIQDVYQEITNEIEETNAILKRAFEVSKISPFNLLSGAGIGSSIQTASKSVALAVGTLLLMMDFFKKTVTFEWSSRWENVLLFLIKIIAVKQIIQNSDVIVTHVYALFNHVNTGISGSTPKFLPCGNYREITVNNVADMFSAISMPYSVFRKIKDAIAGVPNDATYNVSLDAIHMFYPGATINKTQFNFGEFILASPKSVFNATLERIFLMPYFFVMKIIAYFIFVVVVGRAFELCVYTLLAPIPLCTYASEETYDIAKNFLKNYVACILQMAVIATMFAVYSALMSSAEFSGYFGSIKLLEIILLAALALGVGRSGEWSRRLCGA